MWEMPFKSKILHLQALRIPCGVARPPRWTVFLPCHPWVLRPINSVTRKHRQQPCPTWVRSKRLNDNQLFNGNGTLNGPVAIALDPGTNIALVANQGNNTVSVLNLGAIQPFSITETSPKTFMATSTLGTAPSPAPQQLTVIGRG